MASYFYTNSKFEIPNTKQIRIFKFKSSKQNFGFQPFGFRHYLGFKVLILGIHRALARIGGAV